MAWNWGGAGSGGMSGAATGSAIMPGIGTAIGGGLGALFGGLGGGEGGKKGKAKAPPDWQGLANQQSVASRPNTSNALGSQTWGVGPDGRPTSSTQFTGRAADTFNSLQGGMNAAANYDPTQARNQAINQNMDFSMSRLNPMLAQQNNAFSAQMANSGMDPGTQGYGAANQALGVKQSDLFNSAATNAMNMGDQTQRTQMAQMMQPFQQAGMMTGMLNQQAPNYGQTPDLLGAAGKQYSSDQRAAQAQQGKKGSGMGDLGSILGKSGGKGKGGANAGADFSPGGAYEGWT